MNDTELDQPACEWCDLGILDCLDARIKCCPDCTHIWTRWAEQLLTGQEA